MSEGAASAGSAPGPAGHPQTESAHPRRDVVDGTCWTLLGLAILAGSWRMDRLGSQGINPYTAPGLVPGLLGLAMALFGGVLILRGARRSGFGRPDPEGERLDRGRVATVIGLCVAFAAGLVGHGPPFWIAAALFVTVAIFVLRFGEFRAAGRLLPGFATSAAIGVGAGVIVTLVFEKFFFVRLP